MKAGGKQLFLKNLQNHRGFSLMEIITVLVILGVSLSIFYAVFVTNWLAFQDRIIRADLWMDADAIIDALSEDIRSAKSFDISSDNGDQVLTIIDLNDASTVYAMRASGIFEYQRPASSVFSVLSRHILMPDSFIKKSDDALQVNLVLQDHLFFRNIRIETSTEIYPRNER
jgi:prepilin-type N-terminal cleavage/methylation domain-containing protein